MTVSSLKFQNYCSNFRRKSSSSSFISFYL